MTVRHADVDAQRLHAGDASSASVCTVKCSVRKRGSGIELRIDVQHLVLSPVANDVGRDLEAEVVPGARELQQGAGVREIQASVGGARQERRRTSKSAVALPTTWRVPSTVATSV